MENSQCHCRTFYRAPSGRPRRPQPGAQAKFLGSSWIRWLSQLATAEEALKTFRERSRVVDPNVESSSQITRLVQLQAERSSVEAERSALANLVAASKVGKRVRLMANLRLTVSCSRFPVCYGIEPLANC